MVDGDDVGGEAKGRLRLVCVGPGVSPIRAVISPPNLN